MTNRMRTVWIIIGTLIVAGLVMVGIGMATGASWRALPVGINFDGNGANVTTLGEIREQFEAIDFTLGNANREVEWNDDNHISFTDVNNLDLDTGLYQVFIVTHEGDGVLIDLSRVSEYLHRFLSFDQNGDTLTIRDRETGSFNGGSLRNAIINRFRNGGREERTIIIAIPEDFTFRNVTMEFGIGQSHIDRIQAENIYLSAGVGEVEIYTMIADDIRINAGIGEIRIYDFETHYLNLDAGVGRIQISGAGEEIHISGGIGEIIFSAVGSLNDYFVRGSSGIGSIQIGGLTLNMFSDDLNINQDAPRKLYLNGGVGAITVLFEN